MKLVKWLVVVLVLLGALYFVTSVKIGDSTLFQRLMGDELNQSQGTALPSDKRADVVVPSGASNEDTATDVHTSEERSNLEKLIERRLDKGSYGEKVHTGPSSD